MSLLRVSHASFAIAPVVTVGPTWLHARTHRLWTALSLLSHRRELYVDASKRLLRLRERSGWKTRDSSIAFDAVDHIAYRFVDLPTSLSFGPSHHRHVTLQADDQLERFDIGLVLKNGNEQPLFTFVGDGAVMTGGFGVLLGDSIVDLAGTQEDDSRAFIRELMRLTELGLSPRLPREVAERRGTRCTACGQLNAPRPKCLYCGKALPG